MSENINMSDLFSNRKNLDSTPPENTRVREQGGNSLAVEAVVENKPQELKKIRNFALMSASVPAMLSGEAQIVLNLLFTCFDKTQSIQEGMIGDLIWGFGQVDPPVPAELTIKGLTDLQKQGYIKFQTKDNSYIDSWGDGFNSAMVRYQSKLLDLVYTR